MTYIFPDAKLVQRLGVGAISHQSLRVWGMQKRVVFSMIVPAKNEEDGIVRCIDSFLKQTAGAGQQEVVVVDNGSTDKTRERALSMGAKVEMLPNASISALRNHGAAVASGDYLAFIDADMELPENYLEYFLKLRDEGCDALGLNTVAGADSGTLFAIWENRNRRKGVEQVDYLASTNIIVTRKAFECVGGFDEMLKTSEDKDFTRRLAEQGFKCMISGELTAVHWGADDSFPQFIRKEYWRQKGSLQLARKNGLSLRMLRFPLVSALLFLSLAASLALFPVMPAVLPLVLLFSLGFTVLMAIRKWQKRNLKDICVIAVFALVRFWVAGVAVLTSLFGLLMKKNIAMAASSANADHTDAAADADHTNAAADADHTDAALSGMSPVRDRALFIREYTDSFIRIFLGILILIPSAVVLAVIFVVVKGIFREPGPFLYVSERMGQFKKPFKLYKIRTLKEGAAQILGSEAYTSDKSLAIRGGEFLRRTRLDELPQIFNVIKGDMNIIGPRPLRQAWYEKDPNFNLRFLVKPGLTGVSQLITPHHTSERIRSILDNKMYLSQQSLFWQLKWLGITIFAVLKRIVEEGFSRCKALLCVFYYKKSAKNQRKMRRLKVKSHILMSSGNQSFSYPIRDINYNTVSFFAKSSSGGNIAVPEKFHQFRIEVRARKKTKNVLCNARLLSQKKHKNDGRVRIVAKYEPSSTYNRYLIDTYLLRESIL